MKSLAAKSSEDGRSKDAKFLPDGTGLLTSNTEGVRVYPVESTSELGSPLEFLTRRTLHPRQAAWVSLSGKGDFAAFRDNMLGSRGVVMRLLERSRTVKIGPHAGMDHVTISPNARWVPRRRGRAEVAFISGMPRLASE